MSCLLRAGTGSEEETVHDSTLTSRGVHSRDPLREFKVLDELFVDAKIDHYSASPKTSARQNGSAKRNKRCRTNMHSSNQAKAIGNFNGRTSEACIAAVYYT
jgi:hypothetical protein